MKIVHISDTHGKHNHVIVPNCDVLIHTGDLGGRTTINELTDFLIWFEQQPAEVKIFCAGNHDIVLDPKEADKAKAKGSIYGWSRQLNEHKSAMDLIANYKVVYLNNQTYTHEGINFFGSPYSPSFHREYWAFNADRGAEIQKQWAKIPNDTHVLMTHSPCYKILDRVEDKYRETAGEDLNVGCADLLAVIKKRLTKLKLHASGHIHDQFGVVLKNVTNNRKCLFSNGAVVDNQYNVLITNPPIITI